MSITSSSSLEVGRLSELPEDVFSVEPSILRRALRVDLSCACSQDCPLRPSRHGLCVTEAVYNLAGSSDPRFHPNHFVAGPINHRISLNCSPLVIQHIDASLALPTNTQVFRASAASWAILLRARASSAWGWDSVWTAVGFPVMVVHDPLYLVLVLGPVDARAFGGEGM